MFEQDSPSSRSSKPRVLDERDQRIAKLEMDDALLLRRVSNETLSAEKAEAQVELQAKMRLASSG